MVQIAIEINDWITHAKLICPCRYFVKISFHCNANMWPWKLDSALLFSLELIPERLYLPFVVFDVEFAAFAAFAAFADATLYSKWKNNKGHRQSCKILWHWGMLWDVKKLYCFLFYITYQGLSDTHKTLNYTESVALQAVIPHFQGRAERCSFWEKVWNINFWLVVLKRTIFSQNIYLL